MEEEIKNALNILKQGGTILYPTDTIWGIGCDATNSKAVDKVFKLKNRPENKSMILLIDDDQKIENYVKLVHPIAFELVRSYMEPLTIVYSGAYNLPKNMIAVDGTIAIRVVRDEFCKKLISEFGKPIVSTSANISGEETPYMFSLISEEIKKNVDYVVKIHQNRINKLKASTIIRVKDNGEFEVLRK